MKNKLLLLIALSSISSSYLLAENTAVTPDAVKSDNVVYIDAETKEGSIILNSELEYKQYLSDKLKRDTEDKRRSEIIDSYYNEMSIIKTAIVKLIATSEQTAKNTEILKEMQIKLDALTAAKVAAEAPIVLTTDEAIKNADVKNESPACQNVLVKKINEKELANSYLYLSKPTLHIADVDVIVHKYPLVESEETGKIFKGEKVTIDMKTMAGWAHTGKGWIAGYSLTPKINYKKDKNGQKNKSLYKTEYVQKCK
jgi:hypothetical protein